MLISFYKSNLPLLFTGESGTGKTFTAKMVHNLSHRKHKPFVAINCGAIPESIAESELFGSVNGAFTGATTREGLFETANGGTIFLDERIVLNSKIKVIDSFVIESPVIINNNKTKQNRQRQKRRCDRTCKKTECQHCHGQQRVEK